MEPIERDPRIDEWFDDTEIGEDGMLGTTDQLIALKMVADTTGRHADFDDEIMSLWQQRLMIRAHIQVRSEIAFVEQARRNGWSWERIAEALALPDAAAAEGRRAALEPELDRTHPARHPVPWRGRVD